MEEEFDPYDEEHMVAPDPSITRELFLEWRSPRLGIANPECLTNPVWIWLVRSRIDAYNANKIFEGRPALEAGPGWCFQRFGQSTTPLPDGRIVHVGGEHEDFYDADFFIYNDVVIRHPDERVEILGYPREVFPPTDFHSATLVENRIILIGSLGYRGTRRVGHTQVLALDLDTLAVSMVTAEGECPGWIHDHEAELSEDGASILLRGGKVERDSTHVENLDEWRLHIAGWRWERLTRRRWPRWEYRRADGRRNHLYEMKQSVWYRSVGWEKDLKTSLEGLEFALGGTPNLDAFEELFRPPFPHEVIPQGEEEYDVRRWRVGDVTVRYKFSDDPQLTIEGSLDPEITEAISIRFLEVLSKIENAPCVRIAL